MCVERVELKQCDKISVSLYTGRSAIYKVNDVCCFVLRVCECVCATVCDALKSKVKLHKPDYTHSGDRYSVTAVGRINSTLLCESYVALVCVYIYPIVAHCDDCGELNRR